MGCPQAETYTVCIIYIKPLEMRAITVMLDERFDSVPVAHGDANDYTLGRIGHHNVVVVGPARGDQGKVATAQFASTIRLTFPNLCAGMLVGIGGGIPHYPDHDVRLGDVVVGAPETGPAVVQYDFGKRTGAGFEVTRNLGKPPKLLRQVVNKVEEKYDYIRDGEDDILKAHIDRFAMYPRLKKEFMKPSAPDRLFLPSYIHEGGTDCTNHDRQFEVLRHTREVDHIVVHYSTILSGDSVMKSSTERDLLSAKHNNALCIEMEAAGLMDVFPCLVIRGICDYADSHKNSVWQNFAAATAAAYAREVLLNMSKQTVPELGAAIGQTNASGSQNGLDSPPAGGNFSIGNLENSGNVMYHNSAPMTNYFGRRAAK
ncbi:nucleoside phosphorylase domain-containing protein [Rostrohypoxylon terebratum]|nr:nucleoside phosphorylase domain-containing protein [Rostrohypoxylon terebratum]